MVTMKEAVDVEAARAVDASLSSERLQVTCSEVDDQNTRQNRAERTNLKEIECRKITERINGCCTGFHLH